MASLARFTGILLTILSVTSVTEADKVCSGYDDFKSAFYSCQNYNMPEYTQARLTLETLRYMCSNQDAIRSCMKSKIGHCKNVDTLLAVVDATLAYCVGENVPLAVEMFLLNNINSSLSYDCLDEMYDRLYRSQCNNMASRPNFPRWNIDIREKIVKLKRFYDWHIECFLETDLNETLPICGPGMTRRKAYGIMIANIQVTFGLGMNTLYMFEGFMRESE